MFKLETTNTLKLDEKTKGEITFRYLSDSVAIKFYIISLFLVSLFYSFNPNFNGTNDWYSSTFGYLSLTFIFIHYIFYKPRLEDSIIKPFIEEKKKKGDWTDFIKNKIFNELYAPIMMFMVLYVVWEYLVYPNTETYVIEKAEGLADSSFLFQVFRTIPLEELAFRGVGVFVFMEIIFFLTYIFSGKKNYLDNFKLYYNWIWIIVILATGFAFGLYHLPKFMSEVYPYYIIEETPSIYIVKSIWLPVIYLSILGIIIGYAYKKGGLCYAIVLHIINNLIYLLTSI